MLKANPIRPGDTIGLISPASAPRSAESVTNSTEYFERFGYKVSLGKNVGKKIGYLGGTDAERLSDFHSMISDTSIAAIFLLRGGYGTSRLIPQIDYDLIRNNPKIIVGYSDATALFSAIYSKTKLQSMFFGPMPAVDMWNSFDPFAERCFWKAITSTKPFGELPSNNGEIVSLYNSSTLPIEGRVFGGTLTVLSAMFGTEYLPDLKNKILLFEDVGEDIYRLDRYLSQLKMAGILQAAKAILLGQFADCGKDDDPHSSLTVDELFKHYFKNLTIPVLSNLPFGHIPRQWTIPFGAKIIVEGTTISVIESVLR